MMKRKRAIIPTEIQYQQQQCLLSKCFMIRPDAVPHKFRGFLIDDDYENDSFPESVVLLEEMLPAMEKLDIQLKRRQLDVMRLTLRLNGKKAKILRLKKILKEKNICEECGHKCLSACDFCHEKFHIVCLTSCKAYQKEKYALEECRACKKDRCDGCIAYCCKCDNPACKSCISICKACNKRICLVCVKYPCPKH